VKAAPARLKKTFAATMARAKRYDAQGNQAGLPCSLVTNVRSEDVLIAWLRPVVFISTMCPSVLRPQPYSHRTG
jgi:hypothetical protein